ncbi:uncharacterized protein LOC106165955 isoform X4 [Lingula anatina]|uniref:Uncharacterized protein LOC106165955 isoform X4 n=1 Tax=Lingula anatina TaxID=7574 RepID=A0A1S3INZ1_LINAN|nr:uncharacterized protein LOC106165955 isoform X4 [Lingula anatina]|eukprot:XP_013399793.1 uncharacterized protein LOC106165955 isoform X4 [Lingula anatina]
MSRDRVGQKLNRTTLKMERVVVGLLLVCLVVVQGSPVLERQERGAGRKAKACTWTFGDCVPENGNCGQGTRIGTKSGEGCRVKQKTFSCRIPCPGEPETVEPQGKCRYMKGPWSDCNTSNNMQNRTLTLKKSKAGCDQVKLEQKKCKKECKYTKGEWGNCDPATNMMTRVKQLKKGNSTRCNATITQTKPCKKNKMGCKYMKGEWSDCEDGMTTRTDQLKPRNNNNPECPATRTKTKKCKCKYTWTWDAQCDDHNLRTRTMTLVMGNPNDCAQTKQEQKSCVNKRGQEACMYGPWGEFSECVNGVKTKRRDVAQGGDRCQAKAVKTKRC